MTDILVVDDRAINREFLVSLFRLSGCTVREAVDGAEALAAARQAPPDLVVTDVLMPIMDGIELVRRLRAEPDLAGIPVIFYTATYRLGEARQLAAGLTGTRVLAKPASPKVILGATAELLGRPLEASSRPQGAPPGLLGDLPAARLAKIPELQQHLTDLQGEAAAGKPPTAAESLSLRLAALVELGLELAAERELDRVLEMFIRAAQDIMSAQYAAVAIIGADGRASRIVTRGLSPAVEAALAAAPAAGILGRVLADGRPQWLRGPADGLPADHPPVWGLLVLPLGALARTRGWLYFADRLGAETFSEDDEQIAETLAVTLSLTCENLALFDEAQDHARQLETEMTVRRASETRFRELVESAPDATVIVAEDGRIVLVNSQAERLFGWPRAELLGQAIELLMPERWRGEHVAFRNDFFADPQARPMAAGSLFHARRRDGSEFPAEINLAPLETPEGLIVSSSIRDVSERLAQQRRLDFLSWFDPLTGLPNRALFLDRLGQLLNGAAAGGGRVALALVDIDHFKQLNESLGREAGDALLKGVGERLAEALAEPYSLARVGADRFAVAVGGLAEDSDALAVLRRRILAPLAEPFAIPAAPAGAAALTARAGLALYPGDGGDAATLLAHAEIALGQAKAAGEPHAHFDPAIHARIAAKLGLENELREAVRLGQFEVHYQPKVNLQSGRIVGAEALLRWRHPGRGLLAAAEFIRAAEESRLILAIGEWVLGGVCRQQAAWRGAGLDPVPVTVNISAVQFRDGRVVEQVRDALDVAGIDPGQLELELTEGVVMRDADHAAVALAELKRLGVGLSLDDFDTGHSSLATLKRFPFAGVKIAQAYIADVTRNPEDAAIANAIIAIAHRLGMKAVAKGVESEAQLHYLRRQDCDEMQGFVFSPALPAAEFEALLRSGRRLPPAVEEEPATVLVVDDEAHMLSALKRVLRRDGLRILTAGSGQEGLDLLAKNRVQVIVSDQRMAGMSGTEFLGIVKEIYPDTIRIILSGYTDLTTVTEAVNCGAVFKFLTKPWDDDQLRENIRDALRRYRPGTA